MEHLDNEADQALDNLMLSQGWTQFDWNTALAQSPDRQKFLPEYTGHIISGKLMSALNREPAKNVVVYLTVPGTRQQLYTSRERFRR